MPPAVVRVLPEVAALDRPFDYLTGDDDVAVGARVRVPLHGRSVRGWVVATPTRAEHPELKPVTKRLGEGPPPTVVELCQWAAWRWAGPWSRLLATASPDRVVAELPRRPAATPLPEVHNQVRVTMGRLVRHGGATLVRVGPCADPLDLVIGVLHGVEEAGAAGSVVVTTPTIGWAERLAGRLRRRGVAAAGPDGWAEARAGFPVVVGARAASLAPVPELAAAIVLDAHDPAYTQTQAPCWNGVALLAERCRRERAPLVMTSWCADPVVASLASAHEVTDHEARQWPRLVVADLRSSDPREGLCTAALAAAARHALAERRDGVAVCVVLQRLGAARLLACKACGSLVVCEPHGASLFERDGGLGCARGCADHPKLCVACGSTALRVVREGITTLTRRVSALLGVDAVEVSAATAEVPDGARVVVGTEALLSRVRRAELVCFADLDHYLAAPRAHAPLEALRAVGLAGRLVGARGGSAPGHVLVQTRQPDHPAVAAAVRGDPEGVLDDAAATAATLGLPPHVALCALRGPGAAELGAELARRGLDVTADATSLLVSAPTHRDLCDALESAPRPHDAVRVEVDPPGF